MRSGNFCRWDFPSCLALRRFVRYATSQTRGDSVGDLDRAIGIGKENPVAILPTSLWLLAIVIAPVLLSLAPVRSADAATKPNVIIVLADDMGYGDVGISGSGTSG
jgi:hypothetical protein